MSTGIDAGLARDAIGLGQVAGQGLNTRHGTILSLEDLCVSFDGFKALTDLTLYIGVGELRCIIGPNGAGKTTLMDVITGKTRPDSGSAWFGETLDLTRMSEVQIAQAGIGRKFQKPTVFEALSVFENLELAQKTDKSVWASLRARLSGEQRERIGHRPLQRVDVVERQHEVVGDRRHQLVGERRDLVLRVAARRQRRRHPRERLGDPGGDVRQQHLGRAQARVAREPHPRGGRGLERLHQ